MPHDPDVALLVEAVAAVHRELAALPVVRGLLATRLVDAGTSPVRVAARVGVRRMVVRSWLAAWAGSTEGQRRDADAFPVVLTAGEEVEQLRELQGATRRLTAERAGLALAAVEDGATVADLAGATGATEGQVGRWLRGEPTRGR